MSNKTLKTVKFKLADDEYIANHCAGFTVPGRLAAQIVKAHRRQQHEQNPTKQNDDHPKISKPLDKHPSIV